MTDHRATWVAALAKLTTPHDAERAAAAMSAYLPFLAELPIEAFTLDSMRHVAMNGQAMMIPTMREVLEPLQTWWKANAPPRVALPAPRSEPERAPISDAERASVARQLRELRESLGGTTRETVVPMRRSTPLTPDQLAAARAMAGRA